MNQITRRALAVKFVAIASTICLSITIAACSDTSAVSSQEGELSANDVANATGTIKVAAFQIYDVPSTKVPGVAAEWTYTAADADILNAGRSGSFDVLDVAGPQMGPLTTLGVLKPINTALIANYGAIDPALSGDPIWKNADGQTVAIPFAVSPGFTAYDSNKVSEPTTVEDLLAPSYKNGIALLDSPDVIAAVARVQGVGDTRTITHAQFSAALDFLDKLRPNIKTFFQYGEEVQLWNRGDIVASIGGGPTVADAMTHNPGIKVNFLLESSFVDAWSVVGSQNTAAALRWIDTTISEPVQSAMVNEVGGIFPVNPNAVGALAKSTNPLMKHLATMSLAELLKEAPMPTGFAVKDGGDTVTVDEATREWNKYKAAF